MRRTVAAVGSILLLAVLVTAAVPAWAQDRAGGLDADELGLEVELGYGGRSIPGRWAPVAVTMSPTRLFAGDVGVVVETNHGRLVESREVEVAAGSTKVFRFLVPPAHGVRVQVAETGEDEGLTVRPQGETSDAFLVGVLGDEVPSSLPPVVSTPLEQRGVVVPVPAAYLERSSRALDPLSALVVTSDELAGLDERRRQRIESAVVGGVDLVVVATADGALDLGLPWESATAAVTEPSLTPDGGPVRFLEPAPLAWGLSLADLDRGQDRAGAGPSSTLLDRRAVATAVNAGKGRLIVSSVGLGEGELGSDGAYWGHLLQANTPTSQQLGNTAFERLGQVAGQGLRSDDVSLPPMPLIVTALVVYLLLVGPVNGFVLARMGRRELAWATIPALTVVFTGGAFLASAGVEPATGLSGRAAYWIDGQGAQVQTAAVRAPRAGQHELVFPGDDWDVAPATWSQLPTVIDRAGEDTVMRLDLEALQVGSAAAFRDVDTPPPLTLDVDPLPEGARVTVINTSTETVEDVRVRAGTLVARHGDLPAGETAVLELTAELLPVVHDWHDEFAGLRDADGTVAAPRSLEALLRWGVVDGNPGVVWATGTTDSDVGLGAPRADGSRTDDQGTFLAVGTTAGVAGTDTFPWEIDRQLITVGFGDGWRPGPLVIEGRIEAVLRYRLPNEGTVGALVSSLDRGQLHGRIGADGFEHGPPVEECHTVEERDADGNLIGVTEECVVAAQPMPEPMPPDLPQGGAGGLEIRDHVNGSWIPVAEAFDAGATTADYVSPLGEVYVRAVGELHPFDFSGRGITATRAEA